MSGGLESLLALASRRLVDSRVGVVRRLRELPAEAGGARLFHFAAQSRLPDGSYIETEATATLREQAASVAIAKVVERYCAGSEAPQAVVRASLRERPEFGAVDCETLRVYSPAQLREPLFPLVELNDAIVTGWTPARDWHTGARCFVPAARVFLPYHVHLANGEQLVFPDNPAGIACHLSLEQAVLSATCEVIERDAFSIFWQARLAPPSIRIRSLDPELLALAERFSRDGSTLRLFNLTHDVGIPTVLASRCSQAPNEPALLFSAATSLDPRAAVLKCLQDLQLAYGSAKRVMRQHGPVRGNAEQVRTRDDHAAFYAWDAHPKLTSFFFESTHSQDLSELPVLSRGSPSLDVAAVCERLHALDHRLLVTELTTPDIASLGLHVVRVLIPGFNPTHAGHRLRALGCARRWLVPRALGYDAPGPEQSDNPAPLPLC